MAQRAAPGRSRCRPRPPRRGRRTGRSALGAVEHRRQAERVAAAGSPRPSQLAPTSWRRPACRRRGSAPASLSSTTSSGVGLEQLGRDVARLRRRARSDACCTAAPPVLQRPRAHRAAAGGHEVGVAVDDLDVLHRDAGLLGDDHRPRRLVALAVRRRAGVDGRTCRRDAPTIRACSTAGGAPPVISTYTRDADAELHRVAASPGARLLGAERGVVGGVRAPVSSAPA